MEVDIKWCKSSFSEQGDNCLELASHKGDILVRESDAPGVIVRVAPDTLHAFLAAIKAGELGELT
jgi:hypothetical protein